MSSTTPADLQTLLHRAAFAVLRGRAFLRITGSDATRWLNGMVTNSVQALAPGEGNYNFLLNAQGRIQGDCTIYREPDSEEPAFLLATTTDQAEAIQAWLDRYIIMDDVELAPASADDESLLLLGPEAPDQLRALGLPALPASRLAQVSTGHGSAILFTPSAGIVPCFEIRALREAMAAFQQRLAEADLPEASEPALEQLRILEGRPRFGADIRDRDLPQETNQPHALHFAKGCYLGQEIVERIRSRGQVHRLLTPFRLDGPVPALPAPLESQGKAVGELTSATEITLANGSAVFALGYARREALDTHAILQYTSGVAFPRALPRSVQEIIPAEIAGIQPA